MEGYNTEEETLAALRKWWDRNGRWVVAGLVIAALVVGGWRLWGYWQGKRAAEAADMYASVVQAEQKGDNSAIAAAAHRVLHAYPDTAYGALSGLALAKAEIGQHHLKKSVDALRNVMANSPDGGLAQIARLRLARVQIQMGDSDKALATLKGHGSGAFAAAAENVRGDALMARGDATAARAAYSQALAASDKSSGLHQLLQLRLASLPGPATADAAMTAKAAATAAPAATRGGA